MAASNDTVLGIYTVLRRYLTGRQIRLILDDMAEVPGNQSFRDTIIRLQTLHANKSAGSKEVGNK
jgi:hypothetical protein